jgi:hypothetical protein
MENKSHQRTNDHPASHRVMRPEWGDAKTARLIYGICKSTLYRLADEGKIRTSSLRERGKLRGKRLFSLDSIASLIESRATGGETEAGAGTGAAE